MSLELVNFNQARVFVLECVLSGLRNSMLSRIGGVLHFLTILM